MRIAITDSGSGLAKDDLPRVFDRFYRGKGSGEAGSAGLGLAIVKEIVEAHGGEVSAGNEAGGGACFHFTLRRAGGDGEAPGLPAT